jgi:branched-chain amino acid aminotransferase
VLAEFKRPVYDQTGLRLSTSAIRRPSADVLDAKVHHNNLINSILAKIQANTAGVDDAVMLDSRGFIAETNATNLFIVEGERISTPDCHACPEGITRSVVLEICARHKLPYAVRDISLSEAYRADEVFCTGTMGEIASVIELDGRKIGAGDHAVTKRLSALFKDLTATEGVVVVD